MTSSRYSPTPEQRFWGRFFKDAAGAKWSKNNKKDVVSVRQRLKTTHTTP